MDISVLLGGPQGGGVQSAADTLTRSVMRAGYYVFGEIAYASNIIGKHSFSRLRISELPVGSSHEHADIVVALDAETLIGDAHDTHYPTHRGHVHQAAGGLVVYDAGLGEGWLQELADPLRAALVPIPYDALITQAQTETGETTKVPHILRNTVALGAAYGLLEFDRALAEAAIVETFRGKKTSLATLNLAAMRLGYEAASAQLQAHRASGVALPGMSLPTRENPGRLLIRGTQASALAKLAAGVGLQTYYPIAPATDESSYLERAAKRQNIAVLQMEDEAASGCALVGAAHVGVRASTATSGPGFALMTESIGVASEMEAPGIVYTLYQRSGPSTGMPTRYEQADLLWAIHPSQGEFPHIVVAPGDASELYDVTYRAFNWADRWCVPVVVLTDKQVASASFTLEGPLTAPEPIDRGALLLSAPEGYLRYTGERGASPRILPGTRDGVFWTTSDEHDPQGHITEGVGLRMHMMAKRMGKLDTIVRELPETVALSVYGPEDATDTLVFWGATKGVVLDVLAARVREGRRAFRAIQLRLMHPFPLETFARIFEASAGQTRTYIAVEENYTGQMEELLAGALGIGAQCAIRKADGRPLKVEELERALDGVLGFNDPPTHEEWGDPHMRKLYLGPRVVRITSDD